MASGPFQSALSSAIQLRGATMPLASQAPLSNVVAYELEGLRKNWFWLLVLGIVLVVVGLMAIGAACIATLATVLVLGILFLVGGVVEVVTAFWAHCWRGF